MMETPRLWRYAGPGPTARVVCARGGHPKVPRLCPGLSGTACGQGYYGRPDWACTGRGGRCCACADRARLALRPGRRPSARRVGRQVSPDG